MTFEDYKARILEAYFRARMGGDSDFLDHPSPARLREFCVLLLERGLDPADFEVFLKFFGGSREELARTVSRFDIDKMKPIRNFLVGKSDLSTRQAANLAAVLVGMDPRPFARFRMSEGGSPVEMPQRTATAKIAGPKKNRRVWTASVIGGMLFAAGIGAANYYSAPKCMYWNGKRYVAADCGESGILKAVEPMDEARFEGMKMIVPCDTVKFFRHGRPAVWYDKHRKRVEFFTMPGLHPVNGRTLKPVTDYMVRKYSVDCN